VVMPGGWRQPWGGGLETDGDEDHFLVGLFCDLDCLVDSLDDTDIAAAGFEGA